MRLITAALLAFAFLAKAASAQDPTFTIQPRPLPPGMKALSYRELGDGLAHGRRPLSVLLKNPAIAEEIELRAEQKTAIEELARKHEAGRQADAKAYQDRAMAAKERTEKALNAPGLTNAEKLNLINNGEMMTLSRENTEKNDRLRDELDSTITRKILDRRQAIRLKQIQAQAEGTSFFDRPEVREKLALEPDQIAEIQLISLAQRDDLRAALLIPAKVVKPEAGADAKDEDKAYTQAIEASRSKVARLRVTSMKAIEKLLTGPQRGTYKTLVGEPFLFHKPKNEKDESSKRDEKN